MAEVGFGDSVVEPVGPSQWERNKNFIVRQVQAGEATQGQLDWYNRWVASGSPETQEGMVARVQSGPGIGFGDSYIGPVSTPSPQPETAPPPAAAPPPQEQQMNERFIEFLRQLGLESLAELFMSGDFNLTGNGAGPTQSTGMMAPYTPTVYTPNTVDFSANLLPQNTVGYDPTRGLYDVPKAMQPGTVANATGLFRYVYGPFGPYPQPMQPYVPQVTPPTIAPNV